MMTNNFVLYGMKITGEIVRDMLYFPFWWYSAGLLQTVKGLISFLNNRQKSLAFFVWLKNIFVPMYGQYDWQGRLISVFIRIVQIIFRGFLMIMWCGFALALLFFWLAFPLFVAYQIIYQLDLFN
jgi:hypothetical protein